MRHSDVDKRANRRPARQNVADRYYEQQPNSNGSAAMSNEELVRYQGVVKFFNQAKGFGFIRRDGSQDVFVHSTELRQSGIENLSIMQTGATVEFSITEGQDKYGQKRGPKAINVRVLQLAPALPGWPAPQSAPQMQPISMSSPISSASPL